MRLTSRVVTRFAAAAAALCLSSSALAQDQPAPMGEMQHQGGEHAEWRQAHQQHRAQRLHDILNIRPDQEPAFKAFIADVRPHEHGDQAEHQDAGATPLTTPERLDHMAARMAQHQAAFQRRAEAVKRFYAALSPQQQRAFDALHAMHDGMHHDGERMGDHHGPGAHSGTDHEHGEEG